MEHLSQLQTHPWLSPSYTDQESIPHYQGAHSSKSCSTYSTSGLISDSDSDFRFWYRYCKQTHRCACQHISNPHIHPHAEVSSSEVKLSPKCNLGFFCELLWVKPSCKSIITRKEALLRLTVFSFLAQAHFQWDCMGHFFYTSIKIAIFETLRRLDTTWNFAHSVYVSIPEYVWAAMTTAKGRSYC